METIGEGKQLWN